MKQGPGEEEEWWEKEVEEMEEEEGERGALVHSNLPFTSHCLGCWSSSRRIQRISPWLINLTDYS